MRDLKYIASYLRSSRRDLILAVLLLLVECFLEMMIPLLMTDIVDFGVPNRDIALILQQGGKMALCALVALGTGLLYARFAARTAYRFGAEIRLAEYRQMQDFAFSNLDHFSVPSLVTRMTTDVTVMQNAVNNGLRPLVRGPVMLVMGIWLAFLLNRDLALVFVICAPILGVLLAIIVHKVGPLYNRQQRAVDHVNGFVQESLTAIRAIKAFVRGEFEAKEFSQVNQELREASRNTFCRAVLNQPAFQMVMYTAVVLIMWYGGRFILVGSMSVGDLTAFLSYVLQVINSLMMISNVFLMLTRSLASARRIREVLEETPALHNPAQPVQEVPSGQIDFEGVSFQYSSTAEKPALSQVDSGRRHGWDYREYWQREKHTGSADTAALRRNRGHCPGRRAGCPGV